MRSEYSKWFWSECDELNKDTSFAHRLAEKAWNHRQAEVDELNQHIKRLESKLDEVSSDRQGLVGELDKAQSQTLSALKTSEQNVELAKEVFRERDELQYKAKLRESDHQALLVKYQATKKCWEDMGKEKDELQKRVDAFKDQAVMLREAAKSHVYTEREQNIMLSQADDIDRILGLEQALKGGDSQ